MHASIMARPPTRMLATAADWLLGTEPVGRRALLRWALSAQCYAVALFLLFVGVQRGLASLAQAQFVALYCTLGMLAFYVALRARWFARSRDPMLTFPMALFSISAIVLSYGLTELSRAASLQLLFLLVVFEMQRLTQRQTNIITFGATGMLMASLAFMTIQGAPGFDLHNEIFNVAMAGVMLPVLSMVAREVRQLRCRQVEQRADLQNTLTRLSELSIRDALTGLHNRQHMQDVLERGGGSYCVALIDLDHFKQVNDSHGHHVGDAVLISFGQAVRAVLREIDLAARWGGEEFLVLMPDTAPGEHGMAAMERLRVHLQSVQVSSTLPDLRISFSAGVAGCDRDEPMEQVLDRVDRALYAAKATGRNRCVLADAEPRAPASPSPMPGQAGLAAMTR